LISTVVGGLIVLAVGTVVTLSITGGSDSPQPAQPGARLPAPAKPKTPLDEVVARPFWKTQPETFKNVQDASDSPTATVESGDVVAFTPRELVETGASWDGKPIYLVGRVVGSQDLKTAFPYRGGVSEEVHVVGRDLHFDAYIGTDGALFPSRGDVVFALGAVAAIGESTNATGRRIQTAYFLSEGDSDNSGIAGPITGSDAIRKAIKAVKPK
jgi:hypothetical protein